MQGPRLNGWPAMAGGNANRASRSQRVSLPPASIHRDRGQLQPLTVVSPLQALASQPRALHCERHALQPSAVPFIAPACAEAFGAGLHTNFNRASEQRLCARPGRVLRGAACKAGAMATADATALWGGLAAVALAAAVGAVLLGVGFGVSSDGHQTQLNVCVYVGLAFLAVAVLLLAAQFLFSKVHLKAGWVRGPGAGRQCHAQALLAAWCSLAAAASASAASCLTQRAPPCSS